MNPLKTVLILTLGSLTPYAMATMLPLSHEVKESKLQQQSGSRYSEGYVQLDKSAGTLSLVLQPSMASCSIGQACPEMMPAPEEYFLDAVNATVDACGAVTYRATQQGEQKLTVKLIDYSQYNYERCPSFLPMPAVALQFAKALDTDAAEERSEDLLTGNDFSAVH